MATQEQEKPKVITGTRLLQNKLDASELENASLKATIEQLRAGGTAQGGHGTSGNEELLKECQGELDKARSELAEAKRQIVDMRDRFGSFDPGVVLGVDGKPVVLVNQNPEDKAPRMVYFGARPDLGHWLYVQEAPMRDFDVSTLKPRVASMAEQAFGVHGVDHLGHSMVPATDGRVDASGRPMMVDQWANLGEQTDDCRVIVVVRMLTGPRSAF